MDNRIYNRANSANSLQISIMGKVEAIAEFSIPNGMGDKEPFLLKNVTEDPITVEVVLAGMKEPITTVLYSGWNRVCGDWSGAEVPDTDRLRICRISCITVPVCGPCPA